MSFGKMNTQIKITQKQVTLDDEGFQTESNVVVATVRAYREGRHGSEKWANRAAFSEATDLFRFRAIPGGENIHGYAIALRRFRIRDNLCRRCERQRNVY